MRQAVGTAAVSALVNQLNTIYNYNNNKTFLEKINCDVGLMIDRDINELRCRVDD